MEASEKSPKARLCRECLLALPVELSREQQIQLVHDYVEQNFAAFGMCADVAIHDPHKSGQSNPHAHILLTVRPISATGEWEPKTQAEYRCRRGTEERGRIPRRSGRRLGEGIPLPHPRKEAVAHAHRGFQAGAESV